MVWGEAGAIVGLRAALWDGMQENLEVYWIGLKFVQVFEAGSLAPRRLILIGTAGKAVA